MNFNELIYPVKKSLELEYFKALDYYAVNHYSLPIELMRENAGIQLANLIANETQKNQIIKIGIGNGNNGGGGLVADRRLLAWGYSVYMDIAVEITKNLPKIQFERALAFGAQVIEPCDVWIDAYRQSPN